MTNEAFCKEQDSSGGGGGGESEPKGAMYKNNHGKQCLWVSKKMT